MISGPAILPRRRRALQALLAVLLAVLAACDTTGIGDDPGSLAAKARTESAAGNHRAAAQLYERLAAGAAATTRTGFLLDAAAEWYLAGERNRAMRNMRSVPPPLPARLTPAQTVMAAALDIESARLHDALARLRALPADAPRAVAEDALAVGARAWFGIGRADRAVDALAQRELWLDNPGAILANQQTIWEGLRSTGRNTIPANADATVAGWLDLGNAVADTAGDPFAQRAALLRWRASWPDHPAADTLVASLIGDAADVRIPQRIALLIPQSGRLESAGAALRDGFIAAYFDYGDAVSDAEIVVYDTAVGGAAAAYRAAVADGADFIVGPLQKAEVAEIASLAAAGPPTLALNYLAPGSLAPGNFYQFAIAPEHEARQVALRAAAAGQRNAVALVPGTDFGFRMLAEFEAALQEHGGNLLAFEYYSPNSADHSAVIRSVLHLDRSYARRRALADAIGQTLEFEPRRRRDVDFVFIAADPGQARQLRPQLRFHYAADLPVYATAAAFSADPELNRDIDGLMFAATPWEIEPTATATQLMTAIARYWPARAANRSSLYAMGYDAWRLIPFLANRASATEALPGMTGELSLGPDGSIMRRPALGRIEQGRAVPLPPLPEALPGSPVLLSQPPVLPGTSPAP